MTAFFAQMKIIAAESIVEYFMKRLGPAPTC